MTSVKNQPFCPIQTSRLQTFADGYFIFASQLPTNLKPQFCNFWGMALAPHERCFAAEKADSKGRLTLQKHPKWD